MDKQMNPREAVEKLREIRNKYESGLLTMEVANMMGKTYVDIFNKKSKEVAKKYGASPRLLKNNVKYYPN